MAKNSKRLVVLLLTLSMLLSMVVLPASAEDTTTVPSVTIELVPGTTTDASITDEVDGGRMTRYAEAKAGDVTTALAYETTELTGMQPELKFDRNSSSDQSAQKIARELYTDNGHFTDPATIEVTGAPEGYPLRYVGTGDYSGHYVSQIRVIYERDEAGNPIQDENGNYVIKELQHRNGTPLTWMGEPTLDLDGPFDQTTGTRPIQFLLMDEAGNKVYAYCIDLATGTAEGDPWYTVANLEDNNYYASQDSENHVRAILYNGYWGTTEGTGSLAKLQADLKAAVASGAIPSEYEITLAIRRSFKDGDTLAENEIQIGSYAYKYVTETVTLNDTVIDAMTECEALDAMQMAIWSYANGSNATLDGTDRMIVGDPTYASCDLGDTLNNKDDHAGAARTQALYSYLMNLEPDDGAETVIINDKTFAENMALTLGGKNADGSYDASLRFTVPAPQGEDDLTVVLTYTKANGETERIEKALTGADAITPDTEGYYTIGGLSISEEYGFNYTLNIYGEQQLQHDAYIYTAQLGTNGSQTMVGMAEGTISVNVTKTMDVDFSVVDTVIPDQTAAKTDELIDRDTNRYEVEIQVPGEDGSDMHDEVILMVDGSYSMDNEWPAMVEAITTIGKTVLNGSGNTQLTLMAFGMGDNEVLVHVKDADELAAALGELPGTLLYGRSSTNCEAGFTGVAEYIANHDETLNDVHVIYISDGNVNTDETPRAFDANWQTWTKFGALAVAQETFGGTVNNGKNLPAAFTDMFGERFADATREEIIERAFAGEVTDEEFIAFAEQVWTDVYAYSGLTRGTEYPVSDAERAFVKYDKENGTYIQDLFYYTTYKSAYVTYNDRWTRTPAAADALAAMDEVASMYVVDYDTYSSWMDEGIENEKSIFVQSNGIAGLCEALQGALTNLSKTPYNDVVVTDYMSKWVNLDESTLKIVDNSTGETVWTAAGGWTIEEPLTAQNPPVVVELVDPSEYEGGGADVIGNTSGDIYKLTWYVKDGAMLRSDTYSLKYEVTVDTAEEGFVYDTDLPANGNTDLHYKDANSEDRTVEIDVPSVDAVKPLEPEWSVSFESGKASNISFMLIDEDGNVEFLNKEDIGGETSYQIPYEEGKVSAVFIKQSTSGMFWTSEEVSDEVMDAVIECLKDNNPSYKGHNAIAFGEGAHELEYKNNKFATYTFDNVLVETESDTEVIVPGEPEEEVTTPVGPEEEVTTPVEPETPVVTAPANYTVSFEAGTASHICLLYVDADGNVIYEGKENFNNKDTGWEIPGKEGYIPVVFIKQAQSGMIWVAEEVDEDTLNAIIDAVDDNDNAYKGHDAVTFGEGEHDLTYKNGNGKKAQTKTVTYIFAEAE